MGTKAAHTSSGKASRGGKFNWLLLIAGLVILNLLSFMFHGRLDLTKEKRYTLSKATTDLVDSLDEPIRIEVFLKGEFPSGFRKLANSSEDFLKLLKDEGGARVSYQFRSPQDQMDGSDKQFRDSLRDLGAIPINLTVQKEEGESSNVIFPVALLTYKGKSALVNLYPGASSQISQEEINSAESQMEYQFVKVLDKLINQRVPSIGYATGNGEPIDGRTYDLAETLKSSYSFFTVDLQSQSVISPELDVLMIVKPTQGFTEQEKFKLDQYVMHGGKLLCFIDNLIAEQDSLSYKPETIAYDRNLNLTDFFFRYGVRINTDLLMDLQCDFIPFVVGGTADNPQYQFLRWNYFPLLDPSSSSIYGRNLNYVAGKFVNSIDTIAVSGVRKTPLLVTSANSRIISTPALISLNENKNVPRDDKYTRSSIPAAMLLEGTFTSLFRNRAPRDLSDTLKAYGQDFKPQSGADGKVIVVADGDIVLNAAINNSEFLPMGWNKYTYIEYSKQSELGKLFIPVANKEFLLGSIEYMVDNPALSATRNKEVVLRLLDTQKVNDNRLMWQLINIAVPVLLVILAGFIYQFVRRKKYA